MPTAVPTGAPDPPNKIRLVLELYGLFFDELFGHVPVTVPVTVPVRMSMRVAVRVVG